MDDVSTVVAPEVRDHMVRQEAEQGGVVGVAVIVGVAGAMVQTKHCHQLTLRELRDLP